MSLSRDAKQRAKAAVLGAFVADAACMPLHWIYDVPKIEGLLAEKGLQENPEFFDPPSCPFYTHESGTFSPYADEIVPLLRSLVENGGLVPEKAAEALEAAFQNSTRYRNASIRNFLTNRAEGQRWPLGGCEKDFQANNCARVPIVVARYAGRPELLQKVEEAVRIQQNNDEAVKYALAAARVMEKVIQGESILQATQAVADSTEIAPDVAAQLKRALATLEKPVTELTYEPAPYMADGVNKHMALKDSLHPFTVSVWCHGPACGNPAAFVNSFACALQYGDDYAAAIRRNLLAGGDNASRSMLIGGLVAAQGGLKSIPDEWRGKLSQYKELEKLTDKLVG